MSELNGYSHDNSLIQHLQSAYHLHHSNETALALLCITSGVADGQYINLLDLLDQSAASDIIDHDILTCQFHKQYRFGQKVVQRVKSL